MPINRQEVAAKLSQKNATRPCSRCGANAFTVLEGFANINLQEEFSDGIVFGGPSVPVALIACNNCGAITPHALGALDMLPKDEVHDESK